MNDLKICFFVDFSLSLGDKRICEATEKGSKQWRLIKYLILSRTRSVERRELIDAVFGYGAYSQRPSEALNALNATVHRARLLLSKISDSAPDIISYSNGSYKAVLPAGCEIDSDLFDILSEKVLLSSNFEEIKSYALKICEIYRGFFLGDGFSEEWARLLAEKYHTRYKRIFSILCGILRREGDFERICTLCEGASAIDPVCEEFRLERVRALFESGKKARAHEAYCEIASFFESVLSVPLSEESSEAKLSPKTEIRSLWQGGYPRKMRAQLSSRASFSRNIPPSLHPKIQDQIRPYRPVLPRYFSTAVSPRARLYLP